MKKNSIKLILVFIVCLLGVIYAIPSFFSSKPSLEIILDNGSILQDRQITRINRVLNNARLLPIKEIIDNNKLKLTLVFDNFNSQRQAKTIISNNIDNLVVSLADFSDVPKFFKAFGSKPINLGLDLKGGIHFSLEVDLEQFFVNKLEQDASAIRVVLRNERIRFLKTNINKPDEIYPNYRLEIYFRDSIEANKANALLKRTYNYYSWSNKQENNIFIVEGILIDSVLQEMQENTIKQNIITLRNRVNELGVAEPVVQRQGINRIIVELPGVQDAATAKKVIGTTANLEFRLEADSNTPLLDRENFKFRNSNRTAELERKIIINGSNVSNAVSGFDNAGGAQVSIDLDGIGSSRMTNVTKDAVGRAMAVLFIENKNKIEYHKDKNGELMAINKQYTEKSIISLATIRSILGGQFVITGLNNITEASNLALLLRAGSLSAPIYFVEERTIGPSLGLDNILKGVKAVIIGFIAVVVFMLFYYRVFGLIANCVLILNLLFIISIMSLLGATLTLPGIAGIVLTVGMSVDANVIIYERIKEELRKKRSESPILLGYDKAFVTILDANITTLIVGIILFAIGTGPIKGFAVTMSIGILTSMFTAILLSKLIVQFLYPNANSSILKGRI